MRVLHVVNYAWPLIDGYTVRSMGLVTAQRRCLGLEALVVPSPFTPLTRAQDTAFQTADWGPQQLALGDGANPRSWERPGIGLSPVSSAFFHQALHRVVTTVRPDVIHAHHPHYVARTALRVARERGLPGVYELRCINGDYDLDRQDPYAWPYFRLRGHWQNAFEYALCRKASAVVTISGGLARRIARQGVPEARIHVVRNSVNTDLFRPAQDGEARRGEAQDGETRHGEARDGAVLRVGYATTFEAMENLDGAVRAAAIAAPELARCGRRLEMVLAGTGRDWERINALVEQLGLRGTVQLPGFVPYSQMPGFYRSLDLFLVPRRAAAVAQDTTPLKPLEALSCRVPVLASDLPAMRELLGGRSDVHFVEPTSEAIAAGMLAFAETPWSGDARGIGERSWESEIGRYLQVYEAAIAAGPPGRSRPGAGVPRAAA